MHVLCNNGAISRWISTALYRSRRGAFFIAGRSGACGRWKRYQDGGYSPGCGIEVISDTEARRLAIGPVESFFDVIEG
jgi:hypothetical protein